MFQAPKAILYERRRTHEGWVVIHEDLILIAPLTQRQAYNAARKLAQQSADNHTPAEVRLFTAEGRLRSAKMFNPRGRKKRRRTAGQGIKF